jgi:SAM-dependent methyltransferase
MSEDTAHPSMTESPDSEAPERDAPGNDAPDPRENRNLWDAWSDAFQGAWRADTEDGELPPAGVFLAGDVESHDTAAEVLPDLTGLDAVELGCGGGQGTVGLALEGANATGVDFSTAQLEWARRLRDAYEVAADFLAGDVTALPLADDSQDLAYCAAVFHMVDDIEAAFAEAHRVLRPGGTLVFGVPHPYYETFDAETRDLAWSYFDRGPERKQIGEYDPDMLVYHHRVADYYAALTDAGFTVERLLEPGATDPEAYREQWSHKPELMAMVPPTLVLRARA